MLLSSRGRRGFQEGSGGFPCATFYPKYILSVTRPNKYCPLPKRELYAAHSWRFARHRRRVTRQYAAHTRSSRNAVVVGATRLSNLLCHQHYNSGPCHTLTTFTSDWPAHR